MPDHLHLGHHRAAEGHRAHPRRLLDQDRARLRLLLRPRRGRPALLGHRPRLAHGADADPRRAAPRRAPRCSSRARPTIPKPGPALGAWSSATASPSWASRPPRCARSCRTAPSGSRATTSRRSASSARPASRGTPSPTAGSSSTSATGRVPIINYTGGTEISGGILSCFPIAPDQALLLRGPDSRAWPPTSSTRTAGRCAGRSASWSSRGRGPGMTAGFWKDPRALPRDLLVALAGRVGARRLGLRRRRRLLVHPRAAPTTRSRSRASGSARPRSSRCWSATRRSPRRPRSACRTRSRARRSCASRCCGPGSAPSEALRAELVENVVARRWARRIRPERVLFARELPKTRSAKIMRRVIRATYLGKDPGDLSSLDNPGGVKAISDALASPPHPGPLPSRGEGIRVRGEGSPEMHYPLPSGERAGGGWSTAPSRRRE